MALMRKIIKAEYDLINEHLTGCLQIANNSLESAKNAHAITENAWTKGNLQYCQNAVKVVKWTMRQLDYRYERQLNDAG